MQGLRAIRVRLGDLQKTVGKLVRLGPLVLENLLTFFVGFGFLDDFAKGLLSRRPFFLQGRQLFGGIRFRLIFGRLVAPKAGAPTAQPDGRARRQAEHETLHGATSWKI